MGHGKEHHDGMKIPDASIYKIEDTPVLMELEKKLAKKGLKDPWLRNYVWRYDPKYDKSKRITSVIFRGWKVGAVAFLLTIAGEKAFGITYDYSDQWDHKSEKDH